MFKFSRLIYFAVSLLLPAKCLAAPPAAAETERRIVVFNGATPPSDRVSIASAAGGRVVRSLELINAIVIEQPAHQIRFTEARLKQQPQVLRIDEDPVVNWLLAEGGFSAAPFADVHVAPFQPAGRSAPRRGGGPEIPWGIARVNAQAAWSKTRGAGVKVAVIDTGIDRKHPDIKDNVKGGRNIIANNDDFTDDNGHGTHVTGTIAAIGSGNAVIGVAPRADIYGVKVLNAEGSGTFDDVIAGMQWAVQNHMQVASMSLGADQGNESLKEAVAALDKAGVVLVAAAGNSGGDVGYPAAYPGAIAVAALDKDNHVAYFSSRGPQVAVIAPGVDVRSTYRGGGYETLSGTSMATPHVTGMAALAIAAKDYANGSQVRQALIRAATKLRNVSRDEQGSGVPDAAKLVR